MPDIVILTCSPEDGATVAEYLSGHRGVAESKQLHHRALSLIAWHAAARKTVGYLSIDGVCTAFDRRGPAQLSSIVDAQSLGYSTSTSAYIHSFKVDEDVQVSVTLQLLQTAFSSIPILAHLLLVSHTELPAVQPGLAAHFSKAMHSSATGFWLYECNRRAVLPPLQVRHARVEDHDDLLPIVADAAAGSCPSLAALPESCKPDEPFALTRLIGNQDSQNIVLVAEERNKLVGMLVATCQLDISLLLQSFDLGPFDGFLPPEVYESCEAAAQTAAAEKAELRRQQEEQQEQQQDGEQPAAPLAVAAAAPSEAEVREELLPLLLEAVNRQQQQQQADAAGFQHSLLAVTMLCMLPGYEARAVDFLLPAFTDFPGKDYVVLSLPHHAREPPLASPMTRLPPLPGSPYPEVLLLAHRAALQQHEGAWEVRLAVPEDVVGLHGLIGGLADAVEVQEAFLHALGRQGAVVATVQGELVGMVATTPAVDLQLLRSNFRLDEVLPPGCCDSAASRHAELDVCVINPVFGKSVGALLAGTLQLQGKSCLHYAVLPGQPVPEWIGTMQQQPPRHSSPPEGRAAEFTLYSFTKHMAHATKQVINSKIVIAGASETGLSCLEQLLLQPRLCFTSLALLAPGGVSVGGVACQYSASLVARMGLEAAVTIVDGHLVALDTAQRVIGLADGSQLSYDLLVVATGLQDQLAAAISGAWPEAAHFVLSSQQLINGSISPEAAAGLSSVLLYGAGLQAFDVVTALTDAGVSADALTWVCPDKEQQDPLLPLLTALAGQLQLELPTPQHAQLLELLPTDSGSRAVAALQAGDADLAQQLELDLLVGCGLRGPSAAVARCLGSAGLVWDGRLVVDAGYCSSDAAVMGAGPAAKFSRRYTLPEVMQEHYSSTDVGASLAAAITHNLALPSPLSEARHHHSSRKITDRLPQQPGQLPALHEGKVLGCKLPGGQVFAFAGCPSAISKPSLVPPPGGRSLISKSAAAATTGAVLAGSVAGGEPEAAAVVVPAAGAVINICVDGNDTIHHVAYLGPQAPAAPKLSGLVGLPFSYLAAGLKLPSKDAAVSAEAVSHNSGGSDRLPGHVGEAIPRQQPVSMRGVAGVSPGPGVYIVQQDMLAQLSEPWAQLLFHDGLRQLRQQLLQQCSKQVDVAAAGQGSAGASSVEEMVQDLAVQLLHRCGEEISGYKLQSVAAGAEVAQPAVH